MDRPFKIRSETKAKAMHRKTNDTEAVLNQAIRDLGRAKLALAEQGFTDVLRTQPQNLLALEGLGIICARQGSSKVALRYFARALELAPHSRELVQQIVATTRGKTHVKLSDLQPFADTHPQCT